MAPRQEHMAAMHRIFGYLRKKPKGQLLIDVEQPSVRDSIDTTSVLDLKEFYPDAVENIPKDRPEPKGNYAPLLVMWMQIMPEIWLPGDQCQESCYC